jgi:TolB-like protein/serine/threonine protein kinase/Tfp pilus assembly protein PilF
MATSRAIEVTVCSICGEPLNAKGACVACLLRTGLEKSSTFDTKSSAPLVFGDFEVARREDGSFWELGRGAFGVTYLAVDNVLRRRVALKVIDVPAAARGSHNVRERFLREARAAAALRHPNVAAIYQFGASPNGSRCFYAMELIQGETLETRVRRDGPLNPKLALEIAIQIASALMAAAAQGLIHRDLKPANIMLTSGNAETAELEVKVIDFGLAKAIADAGGEMDLTRGEFVGTPNFASPEQFESGAVDVRSDIYSLGATLWFALTGKTPFAGRNIEEIHRAQKSDTLPVEQLDAARVPSSLKSLLVSMLAFEPAARPGIQELTTSLRRCSAKEITLEIGHVLFIDIVGYSKLSINEQRAAVDELTQTVPSTEEFREAEASDRLIKIATGDGMALVFYTSPEAPVRCATQISRALKDHPGLHIRMGIHSGAVSGLLDVTGRANLTGAGLNMAQRVMDCGDAGHILLSKHVAEDLEQYEGWRPLLHDLGTIDVKHGIKLHIVNLYGADVGRRELPATLRMERRRAARMRWVSGAAAIGFAAAILAGIIFVSRSRPPLAQTAPEKSVAVLPFENLSRDPDNAFFADGVQDEILTDLAKIADLKVISRRSVMQYKSEAKRNLLQIAHELGVANIVEGSVQRAGNRVRVNAQLIDARSDRHLWGQTYDRDLADVFAIQSEIAKTIADQLQAKLSPDEKNAIERPPTNDVTAFDLYTRAQNLLLTASVTSTGKADLLQAADLLNQAVARDPSFFQAYCQLAYTHDVLYLLGFDHTSGRLASAETAVEAASRLRPGAGEAHLARAENRYRGYLDYDGALAELEAARQTLPNDPRVVELKGYIERRQARWGESIKDLERAVELDPRNISTLQQLALSYQVCRRYAEEKLVWDRIFAIVPDNAEATAGRALAELFSKADTRPLHQVIDSIRARNPTALPRIAEFLLDCALAERDTDAAKSALIALGENPINLGAPDNVRFNRTCVEGIIARMTGDDERALSAFTAARAEQEKIVQAQPNYGPALCVLGLIDAGLGRKEEALREGRRAVGLNPMEKDAFTGITMVKYLAMIAAWVGDKDLACEQLASAIRHPSPVSYGQLKLLPLWDPLRGDPRFEKLLEEAKLPVALSASESGARNAANFAPAPEKSIAVLPFENASNEPNTEYLSEGISEALINSLSELQQLRVIARPMAFRYKQKDVDPRQVGRELGVAAVLTGKVRQMQDALNVQVDLVDATTGAQLWGAGYDRKISDVIAVKQTIVREVTEKLKLKLSGEEQRRLVKRDSTNAEAYQFYLRGRYFWNKRTPDGIKRAFEQFQQAIERDPNFALGYVGLADSYTALTFYNFAAPHEAMPKAKESALKALALDNSVAEAHASLAHILTNYYWDWSTAEKEFKRSIELKSDYATAHQWYAIHYLTAAGRLEEAIEEMKKALALEPASLVMNTFMGATLYYAGQYDEAIDQCRRTIEMDPNFAVAHWHLGLAYEQKQVFDAAIEEFQSAVSLSGGSPLMRAALGHAYAMSQKTYEANKILGELNESSKQQYVSPYEVASIYVALGNNEQAFQLLEKAYTEHSFHLVNLNVSPQFQSVRSDPRFQDLVRRIGLPR